VSVLGQKREIERFFLSVSKGSSLLSVLTFKTKESDKGFRSVRK